MPGRKNVSDLLGTPPSRPDIRRGPGYQLSTEQPDQADAPPASPGNLEIQKSTQAAQVPEIPRTKLGYKLREDLVKQIKRVALEEDRFVYEVMEDALEAYLTARDHAKQGQ